MCYLPNPNDTPELCDLLRLYQIHSHSMKYCNENYRFHFDKYFAIHTIITELLANELTDQLKTETTEKGINILKKARNHIDTELNQSKRNSFDPTSKDYEELSSIEETLDFFENFKN